MFVLSINDDFPLKNEITNDAQKDESEHESEDVVHELVTLHGDFFQELLRISMQGNGSCENVSSLK